MLAGETSRITGGQKYLSTLLKQMDDDLLDLFSSFTLRILLKSCERNLLNAKQQFINSYLLLDRVVCYGQMDTIKSLNGLLLPVKFC